MTQQLMYKTQGNKENEKQKVKPTKMLEPKSVQFRQNENNSEILKERIHSQPNSYRLPQKAP